jgi:urease accessory protein
VSALAEAPARSWSGHLELACGLDGLGQSQLVRQSFRAPFHISKPHREAGGLVVNVVSASPGLLAGDSLRVRVEVETGASLLLTTPGASRVHRTGSGEAEVAQEFSVAAGGWLEVWPELFIPHRGSRYRQRTVLRVAGGGEALLFELIAPGRTASGEAFAFDELRWATDVFCDERLMARERYRLARGGESVLALQRVFPEAYYASCYAIGRRFGAVQRRVLELHAEDAWVGCSELRGEGAVIKVVAAGSVALRRTVWELRRVLYEAAGRVAPGLRRVQAVG